MMWQNKYVHNNHLHNTMSSAIKATNGFNSNTLLGTSSEKVSKLVAAAYSADKNPINNHGNLF